DTGTQREEGRFRGQLHRIGILVPPPRMAHGGSVVGILVLGQELEEGRNVVLVFLVDLVWRIRRRRLVGERARCQRGRQEDDCSRASAESAHRTFLPARRRDNIPERTVSSLESVGISSIEYLNRKAVWRMASR